MNRLAGFLLAFLISTAAALAQNVQQSRGVDPAVDYASLTRYGPWDDRNYALTAADLELLAPDEATLGDAIPAFYRVELRRRFPSLRRSGRAQYPRAALNYFFLEYGGYLIDGRLYRGVRFVNDRFEVDMNDRAVDGDQELPRALEGEVRVTSPVGGAESAVAINPVDPDIVIAGSNGPLSGQNMHYSTDGGESWSPAAPLPGGNTCCDPTVAWSADGAKAYTATLGGTQVWFYRSGDNGVTWDDLSSVTPGDPRRELGAAFADKEYLHVDTWPDSPYKDNVYLTWHDNNRMKFSRSTDRGNTWSTPFAFPVTQDANSDLLGIGSDLATDHLGNIYYFWPAFQYGQIWVAKSTDGGATFPEPYALVADTQAAFDFPIPSMETRRVFVYVSADVDLSGGPHHGRVYASWTDTTAPQVGKPVANNHARIQVAYSDDGTTWTTKTPHETADFATVDRWHQWLRVGPDGTVHVIFYDTRRDPTRGSVDIFHSMSHDGGSVWSTPERLTAVPSPNINHGFEFGDYNGLDVAFNQLLSVFTDNRSEGAPGVDSVDIYGAGFKTGDLGFVLDVYGSVYAGGGSKPVTPGTPYFGFDVARDIELFEEGYYVLDGFGGVHAGGGVPPISGSPYFGFDIARDMELAETGYYVLDGFGGVHAGDGALLMSPATPYFGFDAGADLELATTGYYVLDVFGGLHAGGGASVMSPRTPYFGFDIARDMELAGTGFYVLDGFGGLHSGGGAPAIGTAGIFFGFDVARDLELVSAGAFVLDGLGGVHAVDGATAWTPATPYFGIDIARDLEIRR